MSIVSETLMSCVLCQQAGLRLPGGPAGAHGARAAAWAPPRRAAAAVQPRRRRHRHRLQGRHRPGNPLDMLRIVECNKQIMKVVNVQTSIMAGDVLTARQQRADVYHENEGCSEFSRWECKTQVGSEGQAVGSGVEAAAAGPRADARLGASAGAVVPRRRCGRGQRATAAARAAHAVRQPDRLELRRQPGGGPPASIVGQAWLAAAAAFNQRARGPQSHCKECEHLGDTTSLATSLCLRQEQGGIQMWCFPSIHAEH